jgi:hypothetical protein
MSLREESNEVSPLNPPLAPPSAILKSRARLPPINCQEMEATETMQGVKFHKDNFIQSEDSIDQLLIKKCNKNY